MTFRELREKANMTLQAYSDYFEIPFRTVCNWSAGTNKCPEYLLKLMHYKLVNDGVIKE